jgi:hypothetical protein
MNDPLPLHQRTLREMHREVMASLCGNASTEPGHRLNDLICQDIDACDIYLNLIFESSALMAWSKRQSAADTVCNSGAAHPSRLFAALPAYFHSTLAYFSDGMPLAYLLATVITGIGLLTMGLIHVSGPDEVVRQSALLPSPAERWAGGEGQLVGRITGAVDCQFKAEGGRRRAEGLESRVFLGDSVALASGLLEITYDTGAKVILQGPVTYRAEANGGDLAIGKLTGKLEKGNYKARMTNDEGLQNSSFVIPPSSFIIHTPTATVTDLGTEFGVETDGTITKSYVFRGEVEVAPLAGRNSPARPIRLKKDQSAVVDRSGLVSSLPASGAGRRYVRVLPRPACDWFPNLRDGETVFEERFRIDSDSAAVDYPSLRFSRFGLQTYEPSAAHAMVRDGILRLCEDSPGEYGIRAMTTRKFSGRMLVCVDLGRDSVGIIEACVGLRLGDLAFTFHPGAIYAGRKGLFRLVVGRERQIVAEADMGFIPDVDVLHHMFVYYDGKSEFQVCLVDGLNPRHVFRQNLLRPDYKGGVAFSVGVQREGNVAGVCMFSNLRVIQFPAVGDVPNAQLRSRLDRRQDADTSNR